MLEVEVKYPVSEFAALEKRLAEEKARCDGVREEADHYFNAPDRDFAKTDEALRIRRVGEANFVTYKGPKRDARTKTRTEIEVGLAAGDRTAVDFMRLLEQLGYQPVAVVRKRRRVYHTQRAGFDLEICLDEVEGVGRFVELEIQAPEEQLDDAREVLLKLAAEWGFQESERRSYLELLLTRSR